MRPGPKPQAQELSIMAGKKVIYGTEIPRTGLRPNLRNKAVAVETTAREYRGPGRRLKEIISINSPHYIPSGPSQSPLGRLVCVFSPNSDVKTAGNFASF